MESTLVHLLVFSGIGALAGYFVFIKKGSKGKAPKYIGWTALFALFSFWILGSTGIFTKKDFHTDWIIALACVSGLSLLFIWFASATFNRN
jgi:hypothetical protein